MPLPETEQHRVVDPTEALSLDTNEIDKLIVFVAVLLLYRAKTQKKIRQFTEYFQNQIFSINEVYPPLFKKILYCTVLDPLARAAFGTNTNGHRDKVVRLIEEVSSWHEKDRVSLPQLVLKLEEKGLKQTSLYGKALDELSQWQCGSVVRLTKSPLYADLVDVAAKDELVYILNSARYSSLFYTYRNNLIHEFREPGYGFELSDDGASPYYHGLKDEPWQLVFTVGFFRNLLSGIVTNLENYLITHNIDPYTQFEFGSLWRGR